MAQTYFPFDSGQGGNVAENQWGLMAQNWLGTGVIKGKLNELAVYADSTGMQCKVKTGQAWLQGYFYQSDAEVIMPISTADPTNPRIDRVVIRVDWIANTITLNVLQGVPAATPAAPAVTQNSSRWEISLAQIRVNATVTTIAAGNVTDERPFANANTYFYTRQTATINYGTANTIQQLPISASNTSIIGCTIGTNEIVFTRGGKYIIDGMIEYSGLNNLQTAELLIRLYQADGVTYGDDNHIIVGPSGVGGNYSYGGIPVTNFRLLDIPAGGKIQYFARVSEAPRTINNLWLKGWRIGD